jgi:hypothetical protein
MDIDANIKNLVGTLAQLAKGWYYSIILGSILIYSQVFYLKSKLIIRRDNNGSQLFED